MVTLTGDAVVKLTVGEGWTDPGASAVDQGDGTTAVASDLAYGLNRILKSGFKLDPSNDALLNLDANGGLLSETAIGTGYLTDGPGTGVSITTITAISGSTSTTPTATTSLTKATSSKSFTPPPSSPRFKALTNSASSTRMTAFHLARP